MKTIYKYPFKIVESQNLLMKPGEILHVGLDPNGLPCVWAAVWSTMPDTTRTVLIIPTGGYITEPADHVGTFIQGPFVWHVYIKQ